MAYKCLLDYAALCALYGDCIENGDDCLSEFSESETYISLCLYALWLFIVIYSTGFEHFLPIFDHQAARDPRPLLPVEWVPFERLMFLSGSNCHLLDSRLAGIS